MRRTHWLLSLLAAMLLIIGLAAPAAFGQEQLDLQPVDGGPEAASFMGRTIDLAEGWEGAASCVQVDADDVRCFATHAEADKFVGYSPATDPIVQANRASGVEANSVPACANGWLCVWEGTYGGGRRLLFQDEYWNNLHNWGFAGVVSSVRNNQSPCYDWGALDQVPGGGYFHVDGCAIYNTMGAFDNKATGVHG